MFCKSFDVISTYVQISQERSEIWKNSKLIFFIILIILSNKTKLININVDLIYNAVSDWLSCVHSMEQGVSSDQ